MRALWRAFRIAKAASGSEIWTRGQACRSTARAPSALAAKANTNIELTRLAVRRATIHHLRVGKVAARGVYLNDTRVTGVSNPGDVVTPCLSGVFHIPTMRNPVGALGAREPEPIGPMYDVAATTLSYHFRATARLLLRTCRSISGLTTFTRLFARTRVGHSGKTLRTSIRRHDSFQWSSLLRPKVPAAVTKPSCAAAPSSTSLRETQARLNQTR